MSQEPPSLRLARLRSKSRTDADCIRSVEQRRERRRWRRRRDFSESYVAVNRSMNFCSFAGFCRSAMFSWLVIILACRSMRRFRHGSRQSKRRLDDAQERFIGEDAVGARDIGSHALKIQRHLSALVLLADIGFERLLDIIVDRGLLERGRACCVRRRSRQS